MPALKAHAPLLCPATGTSTMTIKTRAAVVGSLAIIVVLFFITKVTMPSRFLAKAGFFHDSSTTDYWGGGTDATGFWEYKADGRQEHMPQ